MRPYNFDLGIPTLIPEWKKCFQKRYFWDDLAAGATVACVAIPLSLAIALASGINPEIGLVTAIIAGIVCALFGGTPLSVSGPAAAMAVLLSSMVDTYGISGLVYLCFLAGIMQCISGMIGLGRIARFIPFPVIAGFTAGIGMIILINQLPRALGLPPPTESHIFEILNHLAQYHHQINLVATLLVIITLIITRGLPKLFPKIPSALAAIIIVTLVSYLFFQGQTPTIGKIPNLLPNPKFTHAPDAPMYDLLLDAFAICLLASLETLLSSIAIDKLTKDTKHKPNQELIGQGLGNIASSLFGGIPVTGVIVRSVVNIQAGAKTRRASIIHSLIILLVVFVAAPLISLIPIAALAGILFSVAYSMINYKEFFALWRTDRSEAMIYLITFLVIVFVDLISGIQAGILAATLILLWQATKTNLHISSSSQDNIIRVSLSGNLTFLSSTKVSDIESKILSITKPNQVMIVDLSLIANMDSTGASAIIELFHLCQRSSIRFFIKGLSRRFESLFKISGGGELLAQHYLMSEADLKHKLAENSPQSFRGLLVHGVQQFYAARKTHDKRLYEHIKKLQNPHTLFITCADSRLNPVEITSSDPGELFIMRNVGNYIPAYHPKAPYSEIAGIEFALNHLDITDIVVCGHTSCGAMSACCNPVSYLKPELQNWINLIRSQLVVKQPADVYEISKQNVVNQLTNLKSYACVLDKLKQGSVNLHGWFYDFESNLVYEWDETQHTFVAIPEAT